MRHRPEIPTMTRLLLEKPVPYADLEENVRIAVGVLQEEGWSVSRLGITASITVKACPITTVDFAAELAHSEERFRELRQQVLDREFLAWVLSGIACFVCAALAWLDLGKWGFALAALMLLIGRCRQLANHKKGTA